MSSWEFPASVVRCYVEDDVAVIGLSDDNVTPGNYVILTRMLEDESEQDGVGIQTSRSTHEFSNAITRIELRQQELSIFVNQECAAGVGGAVISVNLSTAELDHAVLVKFLHQLLDGSPVSLMIA